MDFEHMQEFVTFSQHLNMTRASQELHITQSNLSKHIKRLEAELGFPLIMRRGSKLTLTFEGEKFLNFCYTSLALYNEVVEEGRRSQALRRVELHVQEPSYMDDTAGAYYRFLEELRTKAPDMQLSFSRPFRRNLLEELINDEMGIVLAYRGGDPAERMAEFDEQGLIGVPLAEDRLMVWCDAEHPLSDLHSIGLKDLSSTQIVSPNDTYTPIRQLLLAYGKLSGVRLNFNMVESDRTSTFLSMHHEGCVYVLPGSVQDDLRIKARHDMVFRELEGGSITFTSYAVMKKELLDTFPEFGGLIAAA